MHDAWSRGCPTLSGAACMPAAIAAAILLALAPCPAMPVGSAHASAVIQGPARVVDGDTLVINQQRIRLYGIDAPEKAQSCRNTKGVEYSCGQRSKEALTAKVGNQVVTCSVKNQDQYGRNVSTCSLGDGLMGAGEELNSWLVSNGYAVAYRQFGKEYIPLEEKAKAEHRGVWEGSFTPPAEWRKQQKAGGAAAATSVVTQQLAPAGAPPAFAVALVPPSCPAGSPIKGNIGSKGNKIYHVPGSKNYDQVKIDSPGEQYFCSEAEALAAGWRAAQ